MSWKARGFGHSFSTCKMMDDDGVVLWYVLADRIYASARGYKTKTSAEKAARRIAKTFNHWNYTDRKKP